MTRETTEAVAENETCRAAILRVNREAIESSRRVAASHNLPDWGKRHAQAFSCGPVGAGHLHEMEQATLDIIRALAAYCDAHCTRYEAPVGDDGYTGPLVLDQLKAWRKMLSCDLGRRLDCGTLDSIYFAVGRAAGFYDSDLDA